VSSVVLGDPGVGVVGEVVAGEAPGVDDEQPTTSSTTTSTPNRRHLTGSIVAPLLVHGSGIRRRSGRAGGQVMGTCCQLRPPSVVR